MRIRYNAPVTLTLALFCGLAMAAHQLTGGATTATFFTAYPGLQGPIPLHYIQFFTYILGHGSFPHLSANLSLLLLIGPLNEEKFGSALLLEMILVTALLTALLNAVFFNTGLLGASGIVFMLILLSSCANIRAGEIPLTLILVALLYLGNELHGSFGKDNISQFAHLTGGVVGAFYGLIRGHRR
ncbi:MAG TPA: rhomboid family intramembrane serine protease [Proteobacteria bacterium]|nr:rhomboid family intramembrane serine protease [Pseudomonadota bacterium]